MTLNTSARTNLPGADPSDEDLGRGDDFDAQRPIPRTNLVPDLNDVNAFGADKVASAVIAERAAWATDRASTLGARVWDPTVLKAADDAQRHLPVLKTLDRIGDEVYQVEFHPSYHALMSLAFGSGVHSLAWTADQPGAHSARAVLSYLWNQIDGSTACPTGMAYAAIPILRSQPELAEYAEKVAAEHYDPADVPIAQKSAAVVGYFMTEKHGGSDLRANVTVARPVGRRGPGEQYLVNGHKWFASVPMSDLYLTVAQTQGGTSCIAVPRRLPDGTLNVKVNRLKDKLGNKANASSEIEYHDSVGYLVGEEGQGIRTILTSAEYTRLDFAVGSAGLMRAALSQALHYNDYRSAFGAPLSRLPLQAPVLADLTLEWAAAAHLAFRVAHAEDHQGDVSESLISRLLTPVAKYYNCRRVSSVTEEAMQSIGGNAYIEEHPLPRYYREAPLNAIWEGTSNMMVMDVGRVLARQPKAIEPVLDIVRPAAVEHPLLAAALADIEQVITAPEAATRYLVTKIALAVQGALLSEQAPNVVADAFISSRLGAGWGPGYGTLRGLDFQAVIDYGRLG